MPHISSLGHKLLQTEGREGSPKRLHRRSGVSWMHGVPAGLPFSMPGTDEEIDGAMQQAAQSLRHSFIVVSFIAFPYTVDLNIQHRAVV